MSTGGQADGGRVGFSVVRRAVGARRCCILLLGGAAKRWGVTLSLQIAGTSSSKAAASRSNGWRASTPSS